MTDIKPGWYWAHHKFWNNYENIWIMIRVLPKRIGVRQPECVVFTEANPVGARNFLRDLKDLTPVQEPTKL